MRVLMLSRACVVGAYQKKLEEIAAQPEVDLTVVVPPEWREAHTTLKLERTYTQGYQLVVEPVRFNGDFHLHFFPGLGRLIAQLKPDIVHIDEEPYNVATWHTLRLARRRCARTLFFSWQNLHRRYPFPFSAFEAYVLKYADHAICGNQAAEKVWRAKGYQGGVSIIPQFGVDPELFSPGPSTITRPFTICYAGRFVPEKGIDLLIRACAQLTGNIQLVLQGSGPRRAALIQLAAECGLTQRLTVLPWQPSTEFPSLLQAVDVLALPSISKPNWIEQFGRVLVEAMACGVNVVGSTCGEIPNVIGEAGLIVPEGDVDALAAALRKLQHDSGLRDDLRRKGRERVLARFTHQRIAAETVGVYSNLMAS